MEKILANIRVKTPYFKVGSVDNRTKNIWFIFHGYGQLADEFANSFAELTTDENVLIFPQGLSKFYLKGVNKKIGANWMTSLDRDIEIDNYISYLNHLFDHEIKPHLANVELNILGFSQGGHTASRWIYRSNIGYNKLILWGSSLAHEIDQKEIIKSFSKGKNLIVLGDKDRYIGKEKFRELKCKYEKMGFNYQLVEYHGGHAISSEVLKSVV